ncbi:TRAP transporter small permease [Melaminivora sp.]|uniref:TRAP transporter small permease n=1 Tax=Melaminivora sp. TaxID=1933032 RepID=UPI0028AA93E9|nr:TRAP transporter small permease [Melaminivora sp.]
MAEVFSAPDGVPEPGGPQDAVGRFLLAWSQLSALGGILLLLAICVLSTWSVLGRALLDSPVMGDVEMVQVACSLAISSFLPYAQMKNAHVIVDFFTHGAGPRLRAVLDTAAALILAAVALWLTWRSAVGAWDTWRTGETSMILGWPQWWAHLTIAPGFGLLSLTALYTAWTESRKIGAAP